MASYTLVGSSSIVQILSPTVSQDAVAATIKTNPTGIIATTLVPQVDFDAGAAADDLTSFATAIEQAVAAGHVSGGTGSSSLDASGLQEYFVTFEVFYNPPGAPAGTVTADAVVPVSLLTPLVADAGGTRRRNALDIIGEVYNNLVALSGG